MLDADDPIVSEHDIFISNQLSSHLHLLNLPGNFSELEGSYTSFSGQYKKNHKLLKIQVPLDVSNSTYSKERGEDLALASANGKLKTIMTPTNTSQNTASKPTGKLSSITLAGSKVNHNSDSRFFAVIPIDGSLHLTPVDTMMNLKPSLDYLDESDAKTKNVAKRLEMVESQSSTDKVLESKLRAVQVQFKKRETEEQIAARLSSYTYLKRQVEEEPWVPLTHYLYNTAESQTVAARLVHNATDEVSL